MAFYSILVFCGLAAILMAAPGSDNDKKLLDTVGTTMISLALAIFFHVELIFLPLSALAWLGLKLAHKDKKFWPQQWESPGRVFQGFAALDNWAAMTGDTSYLPLVVAIMASYWREWTGTDVNVASAIGICGSLLFHVVKPRRIQIVGHWYSPRSWSFPPATWLHMIFMAINITNFVLFFGWVTQKWLKDGRFPYLLSVSHLHLVVIGILMPIFIWKGILATDGHYYDDGKARLPAKLSAWLGIPFILYLCWFMWL